MNSSCLKTHPSDGLLHFLWGSMIKEEGEARDVLRVNPLTHSPHRNTFFPFDSWNLLNSNNCHAEINFGI